MKGLTSKQHDILQFIQGYIDKNHYSPSYQEIMQHFQFNSPASVFKYVQILRKKGALEQTKHSHRSVFPISRPAPEQPSADIQIPLIGNLAVGYPLELFVHTKLVSVPSSLVNHPENTYLLQVQGDALHEDLIVDGDLLLIEARQNVQPGEIILGLINQTVTVLKRYFPEGQSIRLESHHSQHVPLTVRCELISIQGVLTGLVRMY